MIDKEFYNHINDNLTVVGNFRYISAEDSTPPYCILIKIDDGERPETLCQSQGESGKALFQISGYCGGQDGAVADAASTIQYLEDLKVQVALILGDIGTSPTDYRIWRNETKSVTPLGDPSNAFWGAMFEVEIWWEKI